MVIISAKCAKRMTNQVYPKRSSYPRKPEVERAQKCLSVLPERGFKHEQALFTPVSQITELSGPLTTSTCSVLGVLTRWVGSGEAGFSRADSRSVSDMSTSVRHGASFSL